MTHVDTPTDLLPLTCEINDLLNADVGSVQSYDFSKANSSYEARVAAVTKVASVCYANPKALNSISLFNRLEAESHGLPSSSYEFVPVLIPLQFSGMTSLQVKFKFASCFKYGEQLVIDGAESDYLLTNLRALIADVGPEESLKYLNTDPFEQQIIRDNFKVFLFNVDLATRAQMVRHRVSWQELSRRYVSGKKQPFEFYISKKMEDMCSEMEADDLFLGITTKEIIQGCINLYDTAIASGVKPEEARRILPQAMMTTLWGAFQPSQLDNFLKLRLDKHAQHEINLTAQAMKELI